MQKSTTLLSALCLSGILWAEPTGLDFDEATRPDQGKKPAAEPRAATTPLTLAELKSLLGRLAALPQVKGDRLDFALREGSLPAPKTGKRVQVPFPASPKAPPKVESRPVEVLRYGPEGEIELGPQVSATFNQPMVELTGIPTLTESPLQLAPLVPGDWRWVGTQTLVFQPQKRLPMATEFTVTSTRLNKPVKWTFATPPVQLKQSFPSGSGVGLTPVVYMGFDQQVDPAKLLSLLRASHGTWRLATASEIAQNDTARRFSEGANPSTWMAIVPTAPLPKASNVILTLPVGTPSAEGPRLSTVDQSVSFTTYYPLALDGQPTHQPSPGENIWFSFNNGLDSKEFRPESIQVTPPMEGLKVQVRGDNLWLSGKTRARTQYTVTFPASLRDQFGQTLGQATAASFQVGPARPMLVHPSKNFLLLDPAGPAKLHFTCVNQKALQVKLRAVKPGDWSSYLKALEQRWSVKELELPGELVVDRQVDIPPKPDEVQDVEVDLSEAFKASSQVLVEVSVPEERRYRTYYGWVQRSSLAVNLVAEAKQMLVWTNQMKDGKPVAGAKVSFVGGKESVSTAADGSASLPWDGPAQAVWVEHAGESLFVPQNQYYGTGSFRVAASGDAPIWYVTDDRKLYKPGETVSIKGWLRLEEHQPRGGIKFPGVKSLHYQLYDSRNNQILKGSAELGDLGGFDFRLDLPKNMNLGGARLDLQGAGGNHQHSFEVQEFRRPEFEVSAEAGQGVAMVGGQTSFSVDAKYYAGGGLRNAKVDWQVQSTPSSYSPPHWEDYTFGTWTPWWDGCFCWWRRSEPSLTTTKRFTGETNGNGRSNLEVALRSATPSRPYNLTATATVADVNRQNWSASATSLVHPSNYYVGLKAKSTFVQPGQSLEYDLVVTDLQGKAVAGKSVQVRLFRSNWEYQGDEYKIVEKDISRQTVTSTSGPVRLSMPTQEGGTYQLEAIVSDDSNRSNQSQLTSWVAGGAQPVQRDVAMQSVTLVPNKKRYRPDEVAEILVQSPFVSAEGLATIERHGIISKQRLTFQGGSATLKVPLEEAFLPNLHVHVEVVGEEPTDKKGGTRPAQAQGHIQLAIETEGRKLAVEVEPAQKKSAPGAQNALGVRLKDAQGRPVANAEVALLVVDESVLALIGGDYADPWSIFYRFRPSEVAHYGVRSWLQLATEAEKAEEQNLREEESGMDDGLVTGGSDRAYRNSAVPKPSAPPAPMGRLAASERSVKKAAPARKEPSIRVRKDFSALALFVPKVRTNAEGQLRVPFKLPDNLTRYRVIALAASGEQYFGKGQASMVAQQPLMVRPSPPRFLNFGDRCQLPVLVQNQTDQAQTVKLALRASNLGIDPKQAGVTVTIPANDRREVRFPVTAEQAGTARFQVAVSSADFADAAEGSFPVWTPATTEATATYGVIDQGAVAQPVAPPSDSFRQFGGLEVSTSSTALAELTDAFLYLRGYPFECAEQVSSRVLGSVALIPVLQAFDAPGMPTKAKLTESMQADIEKLRGMQNDDGGWDYWKRDSASVPYVSLHVTHALVRLKAAGYKVPEGTLESALDYVRSIEQHIPSTYGEESRRALRAYALYVSHKAGQTDSAKAKALLKEFGGASKAPLEVLGWMLPSLPKDAEIRRHLLNRVSETASTAQFTTHYQDGQHLLLASNHRDDAIILEALVEDWPDCDLLPKLVRGLLDHRSAGRWESTQENCFVLLALKAYFEKFEKVTPDFVARLWLGDRYAGEQAFRGRSADTKEMHVPMAELDGREDLVINKEGPGRLYYRLGLKYAPKNLDLKPLERGFSVQRSYEAVDDNRDVSQDASGTWHFKAGARVKVKVTMVAPTMRYHVALVDPLPAGLEPINPALKGSAPEPAPVPSAMVRGRRWWWSPWWFEHQNLRDERAEAFTQWLYYGVHEYTYYARATTPGSYVVPPAKAEEMYHPETFGRSASDRAVVE
jgi:uncharacterized protein YfaS (alpha-2-macroglobulin family)